MNNPGPCPARIKRFLRKYLMESGRSKTLACLEEDWKSESPKKVKLSFAIVKPPISRKVDITSKKRKDPKKTTKDKPADAKIQVPDDFKKIAKAFGLPEAHLGFFYEHREKFNWEMKKDRKIYCTGNSGYCSFNSDVSPGCLVDHMITVHNHGEFKCDRIDCMFVGFSEKILNKHIAVFHGTGRKAPSKDLNLPCKYPSCSHMAVYKSNLEKHYQVHENRLPFTCDFCTYRAIQPENLALHMLYHFKIRTFECDQCSSKFYTVAELNYHKRKHSRDYMCPHCHENFDKTASMKKHITTCAIRLNKFKD